ncbi:MAG TPA: TraB/GumN family protein [Nitrosomonas sp.]|nr:TraB/GumN family protein [Nitrosomonas sp.]HQX13298.1 TraB/GumN family protein [Nitrosomonas sp.]HRB20881.1 TraB/GumN family protein [Nitrosomonas sp.]HRB31980.1 TraB/GumN family protein [Nitrosomonas sp.]HRB45571.1 TraB/GumN family protein [Nitrosomonas sp.]
MDNSFRSDGNESSIHEPTKTLKVNDCAITLLGTAHVSKVSADKVQELIATGQYDAVAVELCPSRHKVLVNPDAIAKMDLFQVIKSGQASMVAASLALGAFQQRMAEQFGIEPGAEMRVAIKDAQAAKLPVILIDREIGTTMKRIYHSVPWWKRFNLFAGLLASVISNEKVSAEEIEKLKQGDVLESSFSQFAENEKDLFRPLISERDTYMSARLIKECQENNYQHVLAVIGAGHLPGMSKQLEAGDIRDPDNTIAALDIIPASSPWLKIIPWSIVALIFVGFGIGFSRSPEMGTSMIIEWIVINGGLSALGAAIALAHPLSILTAFVAAPITSLNPTIGAGMVVAAVEIYFRKPKVEDFNRLRTDATTLKGWWNNRVTRTLLIFILSTLGSAVGTYVAGFRIFEQLSNS